MVSNGEISTSDRGALTLETKKGPNRNTRNAAGRAAMYWYGDYSKLAHDPRKTGTKAVILHPLNDAHLSARSHPDSKRPCATVPESIMKDGKRMYINVDGSERFRHGHATLYLETGKSSHAMDIEPAKRRPDDPNYTPSGADHDKNTPDTNNLVKVSYASRGYTSTDMVRKPAKVNHLLGDA